MAGIYLHIPYCRQACHYCNFHFSTNQQSVPAMVTVMQQEIRLQQAYLQQPVETVYFGGGTPSLLQPEQLLLLLETIGQTFTLSPDTELTLEANPDDITPALLDQWRAAGINRLSIGVQSFMEADLRWMNRAHTALQSLRCIEWAQAAGFTNLTIDLIYGTPLLSEEDWHRNVLQALSLNIPHLSCYALTVEPRTALHTMIEQRKKQKVDPDQQGRHFELLMQWLDQAGYEHYEISNFARPGFRSRHNSSYWQGLPYLGIGPSAHSFNGSSRQWNVAGNAAYLLQLQQGILPAETEWLTPVQQLNEYLMTSLRTLEGVSLARVAQWGPLAVQQVKIQSQKYLAEGLAVQTGNQLSLTPAGRLLADGIAADLFLETVPEQ